MGFLSFNDIYPKMKVTEGMQIAVQVIKEASKNKEAVLTCRLSVPGQYCVAIYDDKAVNISRKISGNKRSELRKAIPEDTDLCFTVRTNAANVDDISLITDEAYTLSERLHEIIKTCSMRKAPSLCFTSDKGYIRFLQSLPKNSFERVLTDNETVFDEIKEIYPSKFYNDDYPLTKLYSLETKIQEVLSRNVWLKSGGNILIEHTEALTVIDVNSAKNISGKEREVNIL